MAKQFQGGTRYTTDDLIRMARMGNFGNQFSDMLSRTFGRHKYMEQEIKRLHSIIAQYEEAQVAQSVQDVGLYDNIEPVEE
jgi:hypothetical protein